MQVGAENVVATSSFEPVLSVVAISTHHAPERFTLVAEVRATAVVLETGKLARLSVHGNLDRDVADQSWAGFANSSKIDDSESVDASIIELVVLTEQLVSATDREDHLAGFGCGHQRFAFGSVNVVGDLNLVAVLAAADVVEVVGVGIDRIAIVDGGQLEIESMTRAAFLENHQIAAIRVDVHA